MVVIDRYHFNFSRHELAKRIFTAGLAMYLLFFLHVPWNNSGGWGSDLPYNLLGWGYIFILSAAFWLLSSVKRLQIGATGILLISGACLMTLPLLWSPSSASVYNALPRIGGMWGGVFFWLTLRQCQFNKHQSIWLLYFFAGAGFIEAVIVLMELYGPVTWLPTVWRQLMMSCGRDAVGVFQQVNVTASFLTMTLGAILYLLVYPSMILNKKRWIYIQLLLSLAAIVVTAAVTVIYSRTGWLSGICIVICLNYLFYFSRFKNTGQCKYLLWVLPVCGVGVGLYLMPLSVNQAMMAHEGSNHQRLLTLYYVFKYTHLHSLLGYGAGSFEGTYQHYLAALPGGNPGKEMMEHPHNELLYQYAEGGGIALAGVLLWAGMLGRLWKRSDCRLTYCTLICMLPVLIHCQFEFPFYYSAPHYFIFLILLCIADSGKQEAEPVTDKGALIHYAIRIGMLMIAFYGAVVSFQSFRVWATLDQYERGVLAYPERISNLNVPWVMKLSYDQDMTLLRLFRFEHNHDISSLREFTRENAVWISVHAWVPLYQNQIAVLKYLNDAPGVAVWEEKAKRTFPWEKSFLGFDSHKTVSK
ncbi:Wzy polymerase domain-containing protein [Klebsiella aerogenes]|uniref:PglL family O-oligosaccharyltransferase n=1 Tax=Klebsiella aerogenes TaxID=548 RepID=UPI00351D87F1